MGINDRDYTRQAGGQASRSGLGFSTRGWSVNTWLIAICVGIFVLDKLPILPLMMAPIQTIPVIPVNTPRGIALQGIPEGAVVDPVEKEDIRIPTLGQIREDKVPLWMEQPAARSAGGGPDVSTFFQVGIGDRGILPPVFMVLANSVDESGSQSGAVGTITLRDEAGNTQREDVLLLQMVSIGSPFYVFGYFSTSTALVTLDKYVGLRGFEFWRFITFQFLHANIWHLMFNMMGLYFFGSLVEQYLGSKRYLAFYLLCGIMGACTYLLLNFAGWTMFSLTGRDLPVLLVNDPGTPLIGASAGVFGVVIACAFLVPNARVSLFLMPFLTMKLSTLAYVLVGVALLSVFFGFTNAGGEAAHIGGAMAGYWLIRRPHLLHGFFDFLGRYDPTSRSGAAYRAGRLRSRGMAEDADIDRILAKIHDQGLQSLTSREKKALREASKR